MLHKKASKKGLLPGFITIVLALVLMAAASPPASAATPDAAEAKIVEETLPNGLKVIVEEVPSAPVVAVQMWVRVGSADEAPDEAGLSHVFEHMLFKGTERRGVGELAREVESVGGSINAYTSFDNTVYHLVVPSRHFATGIDIISDAIQHSSFDPDELSKELEVVLEEIRMNEDRPARNLFQTMLGTAYAEHPYGRPVIGTRETVESFTREKILEFFGKWYRPNNMTMVVVGDVDPDRVMEETRARLRDFERGELPERERPAEPAQRGLRVEKKAMEVMEARFGMAFHIPQEIHPDTYALDVASAVLGGGATSRLYKRLKLDDNIVHSVGSYAMTLKDPGMLFITGSLDAGKTEEAVSLAMEEIKRLAELGPTPDELERIKLNLESSFVYSRETMQGIASKLGYYQTVAGDISYQEKYIEGIRSVTAEDVKRVVSEYLTSDNMTAVTLLPEKEKDAVTTAGLRDAVALGTEANIRKTAEEFGEIIDERAGITRMSITGGITLLVKEVRANPTVALYAAFPGGLRYESEDKNGVGIFTAHMLTRGTENRDREEIARDTESIAGGVGGFSGWNSTGVNGKFLSRYFDEGLEIFADVVKNPTFPAEEIEKLREDTLASIRMREDNLPSRTFELLSKELYDRHPYGMTTSGTKESVESLTRDDLVEHYRRFFAPDRMVITVVGDVDTAWVAEKITEAFSDFASPPSDFASPPSELAEPPVEEPREEIRKTGEVRDKAQTHIALGWLGTSIGSPDSYALKVLDEVLSGQGGRLFVKLRDEQSLAYSVSAFSKEGVDRGFFGLYIATAPEKKDEAVAGLLGEIERVREEKITDEELVRAKRSIIGGYEIGLQEVSSQATNIAYNELYGLGFDYATEFPDLIEAVTAEEVMEAARKYLDPDAYTISVVGPNGYEGE